WRPRRTSRPFTLIPSPAHESCRLDRAFPRKNPHDGALTVEASESRAQILREENADAHRHARISPPGSNSRIPPPEPCGGFSAVHSGRILSQWKGTEMAVPAQPHGTRGRILIADDEEAARRSLGQILTEDGFDVRLAANGDEALRVLAA